tara:strand:+ start:1298 stop:1465 length:168 start_codon:yes stop_codon:yes gene_type:complete
MEKEKGQPKEYLVTSELLMDIMRYLMSRPYGEVANIMTTLSKLTPFKGESNDGKK